MIYRNSRTARSEIGTLRNERNARSEMGTLRNPLNARSQMGAIDFKTQKMLTTAFLKNYVPVKSFGSKWSKPAPAAPVLVQAANPVAMVQPEEEGIPRAVLIGGGAVAVLAIAAIVYKVTRK